MSEKQKMDKKNRPIMKKVNILLFAVLLTATIGCAQNQEKLTENQSKEQLANTPENIINYQLFPTQNMWTFIKLDTRTGQMWQAQFDVQDNNRFETPLSLQSLVPEAEKVNGRFILYATKNMYTFILLDQIDGRMWQVQWSQDEENRGMVPIE